MVVLGYVVSIEGARHGFMGVFPGEAGPFRDALAFLTLGLGDIVLFAVFAGLGLYLRRRPEAHKRFMVLALVNLLGAAATRFPLGHARLPVAFTVLAGFLIAGPVADRRVRGRVHPVYLWGGLATFVGHPLRPLVGNTVAWHHFARWLIG